MHASSPSGIGRIFGCFWPVLCVLALATSALKEEVEIILGKQGLKMKSYFKYIVSGDKVKKAKPNPEIYKMVSEKAKIKPNFCLVFEDSAIGALAAKRAGMKCIIVPNEFTNKETFNKESPVIDNLTRQAKIIK